MLNISEDGIINFHTLKKRNTDFPAKVDLTKLSTNPFNNLEEDWGLIYSFSNDKPIKDFFFSEKSLNIYLLNVDNTIYFWQTDEKKYPIICYNKKCVINISSGLNLNKFTVNTQEDFIFCFFDEYFKVYKNQHPYHRVYSFHFNDAKYLEKAKNKILFTDNNDENNNNNDDEDKSSEKLENGNNIIKGSFDKKGFFLDIKSNKKKKSTQNHKKSKKKSKKKVKNTNKTNKPNRPRNSRKANANISDESESEEENLKAQGFKKLDKNLKAKAKKLGKKKAERSDNDFDSPGNSGNFDTDSFCNEDEYEEEIEDIDNSSFNESEEYTEEEEAELTAEFDDFIDFNEKMNIQDTNFIMNHMQKGIFAPDDSMMVFSFFNYTRNRFHLMKFHLDFFNEKLYTYEFFKKFHYGEFPELCEVLAYSEDKFFFCFPPSVYIKNIFYKEYNKFNETIPNDSGNPESISSFEKILDTELKPNVNELIYSPLLLINNEKLYFLEINGKFACENSLDNLEKKNNNKIISQYDLYDPEDIIYEGLDVKWLHYNTILLTNENKLMKLIKFSGEDQLLGILLRKDYKNFLPNQ